MINYPHLAARLYNVPLLLTPGKAEIIERVFRMRAEGVETAADSAAPPRRELLAQGIVRTDGGYYRTADGVALIPIVGTLVQRGGSMDAMSGLVGYNRIAAQLQAAMDDPRTDAILLEIDSNGGEVPGVMDLTAKISSAAQRKPVWSIANEGAFSAAYWVASATNRISAPVTGLAGSIGVVMMHVDQSGLDAKRGVTYTPIFAGARKVDFSPHAPISDATRAIAQAEVDRIYELFVDSVASNRRLDPAAVKATEAGIFPAQMAADLGLIDAVENFDATLAAITAEARRFRIYGPRDARSSRTSTGDITMDPNTATAGKPASTAGAVTVEGITEARDRGYAEGLAEGTRVGTEAERTRISGILSHAEADGRRALAEHLAFKTTNTIDEAAALLAVSPKAAAATNAFAERMAREPQPSVGADVEVTGSHKTAKIDTAKVFQMRRAAADAAA